MSVSTKAFKYDTHVHTSETSRCGRVPAANLVRLYKEAGYAGIVITDHFCRSFFESLLFKSWDKKIDIYLKGYRIAANEGEKLGLDVIPGMEISFSENSNDYLVYGTDEDFLRKNKHLYKLGLADFRKLVSGMDILIIQAHPYRTSMKRADPFLLDGVEVFNGNPRHDSHNDLALEYAAMHRLIKTSGSDFHQPQDAATGGIIVNERIHTPSGLVHTIKEGSYRLIKTGE